MSSNRLTELDAFRGIAALSVVLFHYTTRYNSIYGHSDNLLFKFDYGHLGVNLFFIISGFVIFLTLDRTKNVMDFVVARFSRLYPAYWTAGILTFIVTSLLGLPGREVRLYQALINVSMLQEWFYVPHIDTVYWTLTVELSFYSIMIVLYTLSLIRYIEIGSIIWLIVIAIHKYVTFPGIIINIFILKYANLFIAGMMFYIIKQRGGSIVRHVIIGISLCVNLILAPIVYTFVCTLFFILFYLFVYNRLTFVSVKVLMYLGTISYPLYLIHQNIGYVAMKHLYSLNINANVCVLLAIILSLTVASVITYSVEKPAMRAIRSSYKEFSARRMAVSAGIGCFTFLPPAIGFRNCKWPAGVKEIEYISSGDASWQRALFYAPAISDPVPLLFAFHTWSGTYLQESSVPYAKWAVENHWAFIHPDLRGANNKPEATGSELVISDVASALEFAKKNANIDPSRIYLIGVSGGGYTALLAAAKFPEIWAGGSVWSSITDLANWYFESKSKGLKYTEEIVNSCGGIPGHSPEVDLQYRIRSPINHVDRISALALDINAGIRDGHEGSVPVSHSLRAFNILAFPEDRLDYADIEFFVKKSAVPEHLKSGVYDPAYGSKHPLFRRISGNTRITIFDGGHEIIYEAALKWLETQKNLRQEVVTNKYWMS